MDVRVGTFNVNNLFSRYNFRAEVEAIKEGEDEITVTYTFEAPGRDQFRTYRGDLVKGKPQDERDVVAERIKAMDLDVLALQEVEDIDALRSFNRDELEGMYPFGVLIEGNDDRLIDVALLSRLPFGRIVSWQAAVHEAEPHGPIFSRDLLQVDVLNHTRKRRLFTVFNTHLKSHYTPWYLTAAEAQAQEQHDDERRTHQAESAAQIIVDETRPDSHFVLLGDMNDPVDSHCLVPSWGPGGLGLIDGLAQAAETSHLNDAEQPAAPTWTHRYKQSGQPPVYELYDQIWLSPALAARLGGAGIHRRTRKTGDGSDHDPAWVELQQV